MHKRLTSDQTPLWVFLLLSHGDVLKEKKSLHCCFNSKVIHKEIFNLFSIEEGKNSFYHRNKEKIILLAKTFFVFFYLNRTTRAV